MGDPRNLHKVYSKPSHPFEKDRILEELEYVGRYGLRNKEEFWKHRSQLGKYRKLARYAKTIPEDQEKLLTQQIVGKLNRWGILPDGSTLDDILKLSVEKFLNRRIQTLVFKKGLAKTVYQARQLVVHGHIAIDGQKMSSPSYLVKAAEEDKLEYYYKSPFVENKDKLFQEKKSKKSSKKKSRKKSRKGRDQQRRRRRS